VSPGRVVDFPGMNCLGFELALSPGTHRRFPSGECRSEAECTAIASRIGWRFGTNIYELDRLGVTTPLAPQAPVGDSTHIQNLATA